MTNTRSEKLAQFLKQHRERAESIPAEKLLAIVTVLILDLAEAGDEVADKIAELEERVLQLEERAREH